MQLLTGYLEDKIADVLRAEGIISIYEASEKYGVPITTIKDRIRFNKLNYYLISDRRYIQESEFAEWVKTRYRPKPKLRRVDISPAETIVSTL